MSDFALYRVSWDFSTVPRLWYGGAHFVGQGEGYLELFPFRDMPKVCPLPPYAAATRCPVLICCMARLLSAYAPPLRCPVLTQRRCAMSGTEKAFGATRTLLQ
eukprot:806580-Rhodomonas_salina.2